MSISLMSLCLRMRHPSEALGTSFCCMTNFSAHVKDYGGLVEEHP